jgi:hypothetical protein
VGKSWMSDTDASSTIYSVMKTLSANLTTDSLKFRGLGSPRRSRVPLQVSKKGVEKSGIKMRLRIKINKI